MPKICRTLRRNDGTPYTTCFEPSGAIRGRPARLRGESTRNPDAAPAYSRGTLPAYSLGSPPAYRDDRGTPPAYSGTAKKADFKTTAENAYKEIGKARANVDFYTRTYYKSGRKKGQFKNLMLTTQGMEDQRRWDTEIEAKMARKYGLPKNWDEKYRDKYGNGTPNDLSRHVAQNEGAKNPYRN